jgi:hypothetical protein
VAVLRRSIKGLLEMSQLRHSEESRFCGMTKNLQFVAGQVRQILRFAQNDMPLGFCNSPIK